MDDESLKQSSSKPILSSKTNPTGLRAARVIHTTPKITQQPENIEPSRGEKAHFRVKAEGEGELTYQWYFNGKPISGANSPSLMAQQVDNQHCGTYFCEIKNSNGSERTEAVFLRLALVDIRDIEIQVLHLQNMGKSLLLDVVKPDKDLLKPFQLKWTRNGEPIAGANNSSIEVPPYLQSLGGVFRLIATRSSKVIFSNIIEIKGAHTTVKKETKGSGAKDAFFDPFEDDKPALFLKPELSSKEEPADAFFDPLAEKHIDPKFKLLLKKKNYLENLLSRWKMHSQVRQREIAGPNWKKSA